MDSDFIGPVNIGSEEMVTINQLAGMAIAISDKNLTIKNIERDQKFPLGILRIKRKITPHRFGI